MRNIIESKIIKVNENTILPLVEIKALSDITLNLEVYKDNAPVQLTGQSVSLGAERPDGTNIQQDTDIIINGNKVQIKLKNNIIEIPGTVLCELIISDDEGTTTTANFQLKVSKKLVGGSKISAEDIETLEKIKRAEVVRIAKETEREEAEKIRKTAESAREAKETTREQNEATRQRNEQTRISNENTRQNAENNRNSNERTRQSNETTRESEFGNIKNTANELIENMRNVLDDNKVNMLEQEIKEARGEARVLKDRLNAMDGVSNSIKDELKHARGDGKIGDRLNAIDGVNNQQWEAINRKLEGVTWAQVQDKPSTFAPTPLQTSPLWEGVIYLTDTQTVTPNKTLSNCRTGWVLVFSKYEGDVAKNEAFTLHYILKDTVMTNENRGYNLLIPAKVARDVTTIPLANKYVYVNNTTIKGYRTNTAYENANFVLRYVYEF